MQYQRIASGLGVAALAVALIVACGGSDSEVSPSGADGGPTGGGGRSTEPAGQSCSGPTQCYTHLEAGSVTGDVTCLTKVPNGYCTHTCKEDSECCAVPGECRTSVKQVCSPFENDSTKYCFLSCADDDIARAIAANASAGYYDGGATDAASVADAYCRSYAGPSTSCRSSGGGKENRKLCIPNE